MTQDLKDKLAGRVPLCDAIQLSDTFGNIFHFQIEEVMDAGGSCICYRAGRQVAKDHFVRGTLKEFYPHNAIDLCGCTFDLIRVSRVDALHANQLRTRVLTKPNFIKERDEFIAAYERIREAQKHVPEIENFIASFSVYKGIAESKDSDNYTYYIWTEGENTLISFETYLGQMRNEVRTCIKENNNINRNLADCFGTVLLTVRSLASALKVLHSLDMLHLDVKPANFGVHTNFGKTIPSFISMFDINSVYSAGNQTRRFAGTEGFRDPNLASGKREEDINLHCDIYSLGATLYYATVFSEAENEDQMTNLYHTENFDEIEPRIAASALFTWSELNAQAGVYEAFVRILKRCLARGERQRAQTENYSSVSELLKELDVLIQKVNGIIAQDFFLPTGKTAVTEVIEREKLFDASVDTGATGAIQCLLYDFPLYDYENDGIVDVLVLGGGTYAQKFIDIAFELSQIKNCNLNVTVISKEKNTDERRFLNLRPDFPRFFSVNGNRALEEPYGSIRFLGTDENGFTSAGDNLRKLRAVVGKLKHKFSYVFIALGDNALNRKLATELSGAAELIESDSEKQKPLINYVIYTTKQPGIGTQDVGSVQLNPVWVENVLVAHKDFGSLHRMALNAHLTWGNGLNLDLKKVRAEFKSPYYFNSSLSNVLSLKYKLHSVGVDWDIDNCAKMTASIEEKLQQENENGSVRKELAMYEHRRWVVNYVCMGWRGVAESDYIFLNNDNKDKRNRRHTGIVPSTVCNALQAPFWQDPDNWDREDLLTRREFLELDALDRMSVQLHRAYRKKSASVDVAAIIDDAMELKNCLCGEPVVQAAFSSYYACLQGSINHGEKNIAESCKSYRYYMDNLKKQLNKDTPAGAAALSHLANIEKAFKPILLANEYTDFKSKDDALIRNIPFILNYSVNMRLCIPFEMTTEHRFKNIASSLVLNPCTVTYLVDIEDAEREESKLKEALCYVAQLIRNHNLQTRITVVLLNESGDSLPVRKLAADIEKNYDCIYNCICICEDTAENLMKKLRDYITAVNNSAAAFSAAERNQTRLSNWLDSICESLPSYSFDSVSLQFRTDENCLWLNHIPFTVRLNVEDLFCVDDRISHSHEPDMLKDYRYFWDNFYRFGKDTAQQHDYAAAWKIMCSSLRTYAEHNDRLCEIEILPNKADASMQPFMLYAPVACRDALKKIFSILQAPQYRLIGKNSFIEEYSSAALRLTLNCNSTVRAAIIKLIADPYRLSDAAQITLRREGNKLVVNCNDLRVPHLLLPHVPKRNEPGGNVNDSAQTDFVIRDFLEKLADDGYLINFSRELSEMDNEVGIDNETKKEWDVVSFSYCSVPVKEVLTKEEKLLELYVYYELLQSGYYDAVRNGVELHRVDGADSLATDEIDIVTVKGLTAQIAEVKASNTLLPEFYTKLCACAKNFGINTQPLLIADLQDRIKGEHISDSDFIRRGETEYGVTTVCRPGDIQNIASVMQVLSKNKNGE